jgi:bifunctional UDP-N-acetylglucosamine pyrophosphorylase/glucosamine-1-phosphate N-acetyltransferase
MGLAAIILAAGKSTRMKSNKPKVLHEVCGKPMLHYVLQACYSAGVERVLVVVGYAKDEVIARFADDERISWVEQSEQLGTGHAAKMCEPELRKHPNDDVFILTGDGPMIRDEILRTLLDAQQSDRAAASMATALLDDPFGYGRIIRDGSGNFLDIIEQIDCTSEQRDIREVFPSYYCIKAEELIDALAKLKNDNKKSEYYLTDIYGILRREGKRITAVQAVAPEDVLAVNTRQQLMQVDGAMQDRIQRKLMESGVSIVSPVNTYIQAGCVIGADTSIEPFTFIGCDCEIGAECQIGPFAALPAASIVPEGSTISGDIGAYARTTR